MAIGSSITSFTLIPDADTASSRALRCSAVELYGTVTTAEGREGRHERIVGREGRERGGREGWMEGGGGGGREGGKQGKGGGARAGRDKSRLSRSQFVTVPQSQSSLSLPFLPPFPYPCCPELLHSPDLGADPI